MDHHGQFEVRRVRRQRQPGRGGAQLLVDIHLVLRLAPGRRVVHELPQRDRRAVGAARCAGRPRGAPAPRCGARSAANCRAPARSPAALSSRRAAPAVQGTAEEVAQALLRRLGRLGWFVRCCPTERSRFLPALLHVTLWVHTQQPSVGHQSREPRKRTDRNQRAARQVPARPAVTLQRRGQTRLPAVHALQDMFQPFSPLSGETVLSGEFFTTTTSPTRELS